MAESMMKAPSRQHFVAKSLYVLEFLEAINLFRLSKFLFVLASLPERIKS